MSEIERLLPDARVTRIEDLRPRTTAPGPWADEPDRIAWTDEATGLPCVMKRNGLGTWCGYVGVPSGHPWHGGCDEIDVDVHGGLTYSAACDGDPEEGVCHVADGDDAWWLGFDCAHAGDVAPGLPALDGDVYRTVPWVIAEVQRLATAAKEAT